MREIINEEVSVVMFYSAKQRIAKPHLLHWQSKDYSIGVIDYYRSVKEGSVLFHIYEFVNTEETLWFRIKLNTSNLHWTLEAVSDGLSS
jgi:hypothetical protein